VLTLMVFFAIYLQLTPLSHSPDTRAGLFYQTLSHIHLAWLFGVVFIYALLALAMGVVNFWNDIGEPLRTLGNSASLWQAIKDAGSLRYLDGAGEGCYVNDTAGQDHRRLFHHCTFYGFMLCFASTSVATLYHSFGYEAPYAVFSLPVVLGTAGGIGLIIGPLGLIWQKSVILPELKNESARGLDYSFLIMLLLVGVSGLLLLALRDTPVLHLLLAAHLGFVWSFFLLMPYSKMVHGLYRFTALVRYAAEMQRAKLRPSE
jgi:citrate/tricarballylate utilization protein